MYFKNRHEAGKQLAAKLLRYKNDPNAIVIGLPRGGIVVAYEAARQLNLPLDMICARKVGAPYNPELAIGAVTESGEGYFNESLIHQLGATQDYINKAVEHESKEAQRRLNAYRKTKLPLNIEDKTVILIDDGIATGATMKASIKTAKALGADRIVVAVPVSAQDTLYEIKDQVDEVIALMAPEFFNAVGEFYLDFSQTSDDEVIKYLNEPA